VSACEKCWSDAGGDYARYLELLEERKNRPCSPEQQAGTVRPTLTLVDAYEVTRLASPRGWRLPPVDEIERQRALEAREDQRRDDDYREENDE
jgi:hypothetical protein